MSLRPNLFIFNENLIEVKAKCVCVASSLAVRLSFHQQITVFSLVLQKTRPKARQSSISKPPESSYFGVPLANVVTLDRPIPFFIEKCIRYIEATGKSLCTFFGVLSGFYFTLIVIVLYTEALRNVKVL